MEYYSKNKWIVNKDGYEPVLAECFYSSEKMEFCISNRNRCVDLDGKTFFDTEEDAIEAHSKIMDNLKKEAQSVKERIEILDDSCLDYNYYLPQYIVDDLNRVDECHIPYNMKEKIHLLLTRRILNIEACSIPVDKVSAIKWGERKAAILIDGKEITACDSDLLLLELAFGSNKSGETYTYLD